MSKVNFGEKLSKFSEQWTPKVIAEMNDYQFKLVKIEGEFVWHEHPDTDEAFIVHGGLPSRITIVEATVPGSRQQGLRRWIP